MSNMPENANINVLIVDDERIIIKEISKFLSKHSYSVFEAGSPKAAFSVLEKEKIDILVLDVNLPEKSGLVVLEEVKKQYPEVEVIMITGHGDMDAVVKSMRLGAFDFFNKPLSLIDIKNSIERTQKYVMLSNRYENLKKGYKQISKELQRELENIVGESEAIKSVIELTLNAASSYDTSVLITGPSGSGKELVAKVLHYASERNDSIFFPVNCSAIPETLIESEFFGHKKGSFTGALEDKEGAFEAANGGTIFLDEIGDLPLQAQAKLLRVLEEKKVKRIGSNKEIAVNVRVVSATNKNLLEEIEKKNFREDLYYRLNTLEIHLPPLRERKEDIPLLVEYYANVYAKKMNKSSIMIDKNIKDFLKSYDFPGNVRELKNMVERAVILSDGKILKKDHFPIFSLRERRPEETEAEINLNGNLDLELVNEVEKQILEEALKRTDNHKANAAELLGISRHAFDRRAKKYNL